MGRDNYTAVLLEDMNSKFDRTIEVVLEMRDEMKLLAKQEDIEEVKKDVKTIKKALTSTNRQVANHETRITQLETA